MFGASGCAPHYTDVIMGAMGWVSNHQLHDCLLKRLFMCRSKETPKLCVTSLCEGNSPGTGEFPAQMASNAENISIWWRHHMIWGKGIHGDWNNWLLPCWQLGKPWRLTYLIFHQMRNTRACSRRHISVQHLGHSYDIPKISYWYTYIFYFALFLFSREHIRVARKVL